MPAAGPWALPERLTKPSGPALACQWMPTPDTPTSVRPSASEQCQPAVARPRALYGFNLTFAAVFFAATCSSSTAMPASSQFINDCIAGYLNC